MFVCVGFYSGFQISFPDADAANIEDILTLDERSSWMEFDGSISGESKGNYEVVCEKNGQKSVKAIDKTPASPNSKKADKRPMPKKDDRKPAQKKDNKMSVPKKGGEKATKAAQKGVDIKPVPKTPQKPAPKSKGSGKE